MGIITENPRGLSSRAPLDAIELVHTKSDVEPETSPLSASTGSQPSGVISAGCESLSLANHCVIYRNRVGGQRVINVIPLKNIDSFCIETRRSPFILCLAVLCLAAALIAGSWSLLLPSIAEWFFSSGDPAPSSLPQIWVPTLLLAAAVSAFLVYRVCPNVRLVIYTLSGCNPIELSLSSRIRKSAEQFFIDLQSRMQNV